MEKVILLIALLSPFSRAFAESSPFCPPLNPPGRNQKVEFVESGNVGDLLQRLRTASPDTTLLLSDGVYHLAPGQSLEVNTPRVAIRSASGKRNAVVIEGGNINIAVNADDFTVADITLRNPKFHNIQVRGNLGVLRTKIYNVVMMDAGQQLLKVSAGDGTKGKFADYGLVACSLMAYSTYSRGNGVTPPDYTNGVDLLAGKGWIIRDNTFRRIRSEAGPAGPAILAWKNAIDTRVERNVIVDSWRGIAFGLMPADRYSRGGAQVPYDHQNGIAVNNVILALHETGDAAIENSFAFNSHIAYNTVYYNEAIQHAVNWSIEYRFPPTTALIANNLTNLPILKRAPAPLQDARMEGNVTEAKSSWFRDIMAEDYHLSAGAPAIDRGAALSENLADIDGDSRPAGRMPDVGADEYLYGLERGE